MIALADVGVNDLQKKASLMIASLGGIVDDSPVGGFVDDSFGGRLCR